MRKFMLVSVLFVAVSAQAMEVAESLDSVTGEITARIGEPRYPGTTYPVNFDDWGKEDGLCKLLGYEKAVPRSALFSSTSERVLMLNSVGAIERMRNDYSRVREIVCMNKTSAASVASKLVTVSEPKHLDSGYPVNFDDWAKEDGVCRLVGYRSAVPRSALFSSTSERVILINANGDVERMRNDYSRTKEIVCVDNP